MYYFDVNGKPLALGLDIQNPMEAAYSTDDDRDPIFRVPPTNKRILIVDGKLTYVSVKFTKSELRRKNAAYYKAAERAGFKVTGTFRIGTNIVTGHSATFHLTDNMNRHVQGAVISFCVLGDNVPIGLAVNDTDTLLLLNAAHAEAMFRGGRDVLMGTDSIRVECDAIIDASTDLAETFQTMQRKWQSLDISVNLDTLGE